MIIDTHAHLYYDVLKNNINSIIEKALSNNVIKIIVPAVNLQTSYIVLDLSEKYDMIYAAIGIHPTEVKFSDLKDIEKIETFLNHEKVAAIGETGLDYYWNKDDKDLQITYFIRQIDLAKRYNLPLIIHTRESIDDAIIIIKNNLSNTLRGHFHCFSGNINQLDEIHKIDNFFYSFCGNITYKNYKGIEIIKHANIDKLLAETDSPFLSPHPYRGKVNDPSNVPLILKKLSEIREIEYNTLINEILKNTKYLYTKIF